MKRAKFLAILIATAMLASCNSTTKDETTSETTETTEATTMIEETTIETTKETEVTEETEATETTATETEPEPEIEVFSFDGNQLPLDACSDLIEEIDFGYPSYIRLPQIKIDSDEINKLNQNIEKTMTDFIGDDDPECGDYYGGYAIFSSTPGIYSIVINYSYCGWDGFYKAYTFDRTGHVYSTSEVLSFANVSEGDFYEIVKEATSKHLNGWYTSSDGTPIVVDGKPNAGNGYIVSEDSDMYKLVDENLSKSNINLDMPMFVDNDGDLCVCQAIMPVADYHDCERFYRVTDGYTIEINYFYWMY